MKNILVLLFLLAASALLYLKDQHQQKKLSPLQTAVEYLKKDLVMLSQEQKLQHLMNEVSSLNIFLEKGASEEWKSLGRLISTKKEGLNTIDLVISPWPLDSPEKVMLQISLFNSKTQALLLEVNRTYQLKSSPLNESDSTKPSPKETELNSTKPSPEELEPDSTNHTQKEIKPDSANHALKEI